MSAIADLDFEPCYRAASSRDARFDGQFIVGVHSTGIYCRPSCPAPVTPKRRNVEFFRCAAAAQLAGLRACKRCRPDAVPGSPEWDVRGDLVGRAMRLIADGVVDRGGVSEVARRLALSERHLQRLLVDEVGAPALALARSQRAQTARVLAETTALPFADVASAAGFRSVRQFNATMRTVFAASPSELRNGRRGGNDASADRARRGGNGASPDRSARSARSPDARLALRPPYDADGMLRWLAARAIEGVEEVDIPGAPYRRTLALSGGPAAAHETAIRAVLGQQVSVAAARTLAARLVVLAGTPLTDPDGGLTHTFPTADQIAGTDLGALGMPATRRTTLRELSTRVADGRVDLGTGADRGTTRAALLEITGVGPWTAEYVALRALGDPDAFPSGDLGLVRGAARLKIATTPRELAVAAERWRPWRAYAAHHLWSAA